MGSSLLRAHLYEFLEELYPEPKLMPDSAEDRYEVRRLINWFDDKFHNEVTSKLLHERINKKIMKQGAPDSKNVCLLYTSPSPRDSSPSRMPSSA